MDLSNANLDVRGASLAQGKKIAHLHEQAVKVLASSIYKQLQEEGCEYKDIINVSSQLLSLVTDELHCGTND